MAIRFSALGESLARTASVPSLRNFSACGWCYVVADQGSVLQPIMQMMNAGLTDGVSLQFDDSTNAFVLVTYNDSVVYDGMSTTQPAVATPFAWFIKCSGNGTDTVSGGYRLSTSNAWTTLSSDMNAVVDDNVNFTLADLAGAYYLDARIWNVKVWDAHLSNAELLIESYYANLQRTANINFHWRMPNHNSTADSSGNGRNATVAGTLTTEDGSHGLRRSRRKFFAPSAAVGGGGGDGSVEKKVTSIVFGRAA